MAANSVGGVETAKSDIDSDLELKKAEFGLKLEEFKARLAAEKRSIWFGSPLLVLPCKAIGTLGLNARNSSPLSYRLLCRVQMQMNERRTFCFLSILESSRT